MWRTVKIIFLFSWISDVSMRQICKYHDVIKYLNISSKQELLLYSVPKKNWEEPLEVGLEFTLISILSVQEKLQVATFYFWLNLIWKNEFINWNPLDFCNITDIILPTNLFWTPHIFIDEQADEDKYTVSRFIKLSYNGSVDLFQAYQLTSACNLDIHTFPFDEQKCNITMVLSLYKENEVKLKNIKTSKNTNQDSRRHYLAGGEWKFQKVEIIEETEIYDHDKFSTVIYETSEQWQDQVWVTTTPADLFCIWNMNISCYDLTPLHYPDLFNNGIIAEIDMKRRSILHELIVILPMFVLFLLDMAISCAFASPAEKIAFKVTMILQVSFLSVMLIDKLPPTSDYPPVIAMFFTGIFAFMVLGILENACMEYLREQNLKLPSFKNFVRKFLQKEKIKAEDSVTDIGEEIGMENKPTREFPLVENDNTDSLVFLKQVNLELQQIKKHLTLEEGKEVSGRALQDKYVQLEKCLCYVRLILSLGFIAFIVVEWAS